MAWKNIFPEWKNKGTEPSTELKNTGYSGGYKPPASVFNWFWSKVMKAITEIQTAVDTKADKQNSNNGFEGGSGANSSDGGAVGSGATSISGGSVGSYSSSGDGGAIGKNASTGDGFAGGKDAATMDVDMGEPIDAIQLGTGTNSTPNTMQVYNKRIVEANGSLTDVGALSGLTTSAKNTIVAAINELQANSGGGITDLGTVNINLFDNPNSAFTNITASGIYKYSWYEPNVYGDCDGTLIVSYSSSADKTYQVLIDSVTGIATRMLSQSEVWNYIVNDSHIVDNLTSTLTKYVLSAKQGKVLKDLVDSKADSSYGTGGGFVGGTLADIITGSSGAAIGNSASAQDGGAVGEFANVTQGCAVGASAITTDGVACGRSAMCQLDDGTPIDAVQLGTGTNKTAKTFQVYDYQMMDANGKIPVERIPIITTSGNGSAYVATVPGITSLIAGLSFIMIPHVVSTTTTPTLNVNGLGPKNIKIQVGYNTSLVQSGPVNTWLSATKPVRVTYDGIQWKTDLQLASANALYGTVPISKGGTGATTAADALANLGALRIQNGSYTGTGTSGESGKNTLTFDFQPKLVFITCGYGTNCNIQLNPLIFGSPKVYGDYQTGTYQQQMFDLNVEWGENSVSWYSTETDSYMPVKKQHNETIATYYWVAIG